MSLVELDKKFIDAVLLEKAGDYSQAIKEYLYIINNDDKYRNAYLNLGSLFSRMDQLERAMEFYYKALKLGEDSISFFNIGCIFYKWKQYKKAIINLEKSKNINKNFPLAILVMGLCYSRLGHIKAAEKNFIDVLQLSPSNRVALTALAIINYNQDKYDESIGYLNELLRLDSTNTRMKELKTNILFKTGRIDECATEIKSLKKISNGYKYYDEYIKSVPVEAYTDRYGTLDEKIEFLEERAGNDNDSLISLSLCHFFKGNTDAAIDYLLEARKRLLAAS